MPQSLKQILGRRGTLLRWLERVLLAVGLVCLGCVHAQPKKSAVPIFRRMLASHERELATAKGRCEPAGQIAARELEVTRIRSALSRAEELTTDVAAAIEAAAGVGAAFS